MTDNKRVRVRFAPSPTGPLHMGGVRTALYNYLFARNLGGDFILRLEDTDQNRFVPGAEEYIVEALKWCGITIDEGVSAGGDFGPYRQSERKPMYRQYAEQLVENGSAYYAFDTAEELETMRQMAKDAGNANWQYNYITRSSMRNSETLPAAEVQRRLENGDPYVIRMKMPRNHEVKFEDRIRSWVKVNTNHMDDKVLFKADGMPTYHLANIVDDHLMQVTHVIRGEEWLPSAPLHVMLYEAFGWEQPEFAHLPLLLRPDGNGKLSKRDGDRLGFPVFPIDWKNQETGETANGYRERGFFPEAFINMLAFLGWNPGTDQELFSLDELTKAFTLEKVSKSGARFDFEKAKWFNQQYLRTKSNEELAELIKDKLEAEGLSVKHDKLLLIIDLVKERAVFPEDIIEEGRFLFETPTTYDEKVVEKKWDEQSPGYIKELRERLAMVADFNSENTERVFKQYLEDRSLGFGKVAPQMRVAVTGKGMGPAMFDIFEILGKDEVLARIDRALATLQ
jgi:glutamyl-tRNA synthetase